MKHKVCRFWYFPDFYRPFFVMYIKTPSVEPNSDTDDNPTTFSLMKTTVLDVNENVVVNENVFGLSY